MNILTALSNLLKGKNTDYTFELITRRDIGAAYGLAPVAQEGVGHLILVAVASGTHRAETVLVHVRVGRNPRHDQHLCLDVMQVVGLGVPTPNFIADRVIEMAQDLPGVQVLVHASGMGVAVARMLVGRGVPTRSINWGDRSHIALHREAFRNLKAYAYDGLLAAFVRSSITFQCEPPLYLYQDAARIGRRVVDGMVEYAPNQLVGQFEGVDVLDALALAYLDGVTWTVAPTKAPPVVAALRAEAQRAASVSDTRYDHTPAQVVDPLGLASPLHPLNPLSPYNAANQQSALADEPRRHEPEPVRCEPVRHSSSDYSSSYSSYDSGSSGCSSYSSDSGSSSCSGSSGCD